MPDGCSQQRRGIRVMLKRVVLLVNLFSLLSCVSHAQAGSPHRVAGAQSQSDLPVRMDRMVRYYSDDDLFSGSVMVARDGKVLFSEAYGYADQEWKTPNTLDTRFRIGSLSKQFTAAAILMLEDRGLLKVEDPLKKYIPNIPASWEGITIHHLLTHTSGIQTYTLAGHPWPTNEPFDIPKLVDFLKDAPLDFPPGTDYRYDNSGYFLLGGIIENVSGQSYEKFLHENIFAPLGMANTGYDHPETFLDHRASGYERHGIHEYSNANYMDMSVPYAAGALYSTVSDLTKWEQALYNGELFSSTELTKMTTGYSAKVAKSDWGYNYGYGIMIDDDKGRRLYHHTGGINGFISVLYFYPDEKLSIAVLCNVTGSRHVKVAENLAAMVHGDQIYQPKPVAVPAATLQQFTGTYGVAGKPPITVSLQNSRLVGKFGNRAAIYLVSETPTKFYDKVTGSEVLFSVGPDRTATELTVVSEGKQTVNPRLPATAGLEGKWRIEFPWDSTTLHALLTISSVSSGTFHGTLQSADIPNSQPMPLDGTIKGQEISFVTRLHNKKINRDLVASSYTGTLDGDKLRLVYRNLEPAKPGSPPPDHGNLHSMLAVRDSAVARATKE
jgi:CubicO group peptidase (beta-lactamase class C family)